VLATLNVGAAILTAASLSFLGLGAQPPTPEWGLMLVKGRDYLRTAWWLSTFPGLAIMTTVLAVNMLGDGLRDVLDPRLPFGRPRADRSGCGRRSRPFPPPFSAHCPPAIADCPDVRVDAPASAVAERALVAVIPARAGATTARAGAAGRSLERWSLA